LNLFNILNTFTSPEWKKFLEFSHVYLNSKPAEKQVVQFLNKNKSKLHKGKLSISILHKELRPELSRKAFQNILYKLEAQVDEFLAWLHLKNKAYQKELSLLIAYKERGLFEAYNKLAIKLKGSIDEEKDKDLWNRLYLTQINHWQVFSENPAKYSSGEQLLKKAVQYFDEFNDQMSTFYLVAIKNRENKLKEDWEKDYPKTISLGINQKSELSKIFQNLLSIQNYSEKSYFRLHSWLMKTTFKDSKETRQLVFLYLIEYALKSIKKHDLRKSPIELFELYKYGLLNGLFIFNGRISIRSFNNIVGLSSSLNEFNWTRDFIEEWKNYLAPSIRSDSEILALAQVDFRENNITAVLEKLISCKFKHFSQELRSRWIQLCCHYENDKDNLFYLDNQISSFYRYVKKNEDNMGLDTYRGLMNLIKFIKRLKNNKKLKTLESEIMKCSEIILESWLLEKVKEKTQS